MKNIIMQLYSIKNQIEEIILSLNNTTQTIKIQFEDNNNQAKLRPTNITAKLNDTYFVELTQENNWEQTITDIPKYNDSGEEIVYIWKIQDILGYSTNVVANGNTATFTLIHKRKPNSPK